VLEGARRGLISSFLLVGFFSSRLFTGRLYEMVSKRFVGLSYRSFYSGRLFDVGLLVHKYGPGQGSS
jgi:hypothetical protein